jgi:RNA polymerase sigma factor (sigma-70 family)
LDLHSRLIAKDEEALRVLMNQYGNTLLRTAYLLVKDTYVAEEMVQDTFIIAYEKANQLQDPTKLKSWLTTILMNQCRARIRKWSWKNILLPFQQKQDEWQDSDDDKWDMNPEQMFIRSDQNQQISQEIQMLDYKYKEVLILYYYNEWSIEEISQYIQQNKNTVKTRLARARQQLKERLDKEEINVVTTSIRAYRSTRTTK